jgi:hypothetical protein
MHYKISILSTLLITLIGCASRPGFVEEPVRDHQKRYATDRFSFLPPAGQGWQAIIYGDRKSVTFDFYHEQDGYNGQIKVGRTSRYVGDTPQDIATTIQDKYDHRDEEYVRRLDSAKNRELAEYAIEGYFARVNSVPKPSTQIVEVAGLTCAKSIDFTRELTPVAEYRTPTDGGVSRWIRYFCPVPSQRDQGPIVVNFHLTAAPGKPMLDMEAILKPLLDSIEITHGPGPAVAEKRPSL